MTDAELAQWIRTHNVCFEVSPHFEVHHHAKLQAAYDLTLYAPHPNHSLADPGGSVNAEIWEQLREIALRVLPGDAHYDIDPFDAAYHLRPETRYEPEVELTVEVWPAVTTTPVCCGASRARRPSVTHPSAFQGGRTWLSGQHRWQACGGC